MARGQIVKEEIKNKILETFKDAFIASDNKTIRIPMKEDGELIEIKVTLTAAKDIEGAAAAGSGISGFPGINEASVESAPLEPSAEEKKNVEDLLSKLGLV